MCFCNIDFCGCHRLRKYFYNEKFPNLQYTCTWVHCSLWQYYWYRVRIGKRMIAYDICCGLILFKSVNLPTPCWQSVGLWHKQQQYKVPTTVSAVTTYVHGQPASQPASQLSLGNVYLMDTAPPRVRTGLNQYWCTHHMHTHTHTLTHTNYACTL